MPLKWEVQDHAVDAGRDVRYLNRLAVLGQHVLQQVLVLRVLLEQLTFLQPGHDQLILSDLAVGDNLEVVVTATRDSIAL